MLRPTNNPCSKKYEPNNNRRNIVKQGTKWFDVLTTLWAIALVIGTVTWMTAPAFAGEGGNGGGGGADCYGACVELGKCDGSGGCYTTSQHAGECWGECGDGSSWECGYGFGWET